MRCSRFREAVSARLDGEDPGVPPGRVDAHLSACPDCRGWATAAGRLTHALGDPPAERAVDPAVLASLLEVAGPRRRSLLTLGEWRLVLALVAVAQLVVAWPGMLLHEGHASVHLAHELTSWDLGLAAGFLLLAWRPSRAWGALPLVALLVVFLTGTSVVDVAAGNALLGRELVHVLEVTALGCAWAVARLAPRSSVVLRLA
ncbi:MAG TPA: zf-HC2 domain-containing protein [Acidimicrobiales bacterium]